MNLNGKAFIGMALAATIALGGAIGGFVTAQADNDKHQFRGHVKANNAKANNKFRSSDRWEHPRNGNRDRDDRRYDYRFDARQQARIEAARKARLQAEARERARITALRKSQVREKARLEALRRQRVRESQRLADARRANRIAQARFEAYQRDRLRDMVLARGRYGNTLDWRTRQSLTGFRQLPPGIQKRILAGKPLPPGIAQQVVYLPYSANSTLGYPDYYRVGAYGDDYFLYNTQTNVVTDVLQNLLGNVLLGGGY